MRSNFAKHIPDSPLLFGEVGSDDKITERKVMSCKINPVSYTHLTASELKKAQLFASKYADVKEAPKPWQTVRDAIGDLPDPQSKAALKIANHEFRPGARSYAGHTGSVLDEPSKTIKAGAHGVPGGENTVVLDDGSVRYYTVRESARIQTFPDDYLFFGSWTESMRQIGNAVPVRLAQMIGESVIKELRLSLIHI